MNLEPLVKKLDAYKLFCKDVDAGLNHAYLVTGGDEETRETFLRLAARRIFCPTACGICADCVAIDGGNFFDVYFYNGAEMKVKDVNALTENAAVKPSRDRKLYLINNANALNAQSQNKLLKTYEEPPSYVTIILAAANGNGLLPTIKSRAKSLFLNDFSTKDIADALVEAGADRRAAAIYAAAGGSPSRAEAFLGDEKFVALYDGAIELLLGLNSSAQIADYLYGELFTKENILMTLDFMEIILSDVLAITSSSGAPLKNVGREFDMKLIAQKFNSQSAAMAVYAVNEGRKKLKFNLSPTASAEGVLFDILEARYKWQ